MIFLTALLIATLKYYIGSFNWSDFYPNFYLASSCIFFNTYFSDVILKILRYYELDIKISELFVKPSYMVWNEPRSIRPSPYENMPPLDPSLISKGPVTEENTMERFMTIPRPPKIIQESMVDSLGVNSKLESIVAFSDFKNKLIEDHQKDMKNWQKNISNINKNLDDMKLNIFERGESLFERDDFHDNYKAHISIIEKINDGTLTAPVMDSSEPTIKWINREKIKQAVEANKLNKDYCQWQMEKIVGIRNSTKFSELAEEEREIMNEHYKYFKIKFKELYKK
jgi:hypothetical protein